MDTKNKGFKTKLIHSGDYDDCFGSVVTPIYQTSTFKFKDAEHGGDCFSGKVDDYIYTRMGNPTINSFECKIAELENGYRGIAFSSGMAAVSTVYMTILSQGAHVLSTDAVYGPSRAVLERDFSRFGVEFSFVDTSKVELIEKEIKPNTKLIYLETPTNPTIMLTDIRKVSDIAKKYGILVCVDNTFSTPYLQKPLDFGADIVLHSITKFINGHADIVGGVVVSKDSDVYNNLRKTMTFMGGNMDPHQAYMVNRGVKTLALRMESSGNSAQKIAEYLEKHPKVKWVRYPGLKSHPHHELAKKQMTGFGSMISFELEGGFKAGATLMNNVKVAMLAVSLGGVESLIQHPASMTHAGVSKEDRINSGITDGLVRYAVGIEDVEDLIEDLENSLKKI